jgi:hypothetical protein
MVLYFFSVYRFSARSAEKRYTKKIGTYRAAAGNMGLSDAA